MGFRVIDDRFKLFKHYVSIGFAALVQRGSRLQVLVRPCDSCIDILLGPCHFLQRLFPGGIWKLSSLASTRGPRTRSRWLDDFEVAPPSFGVPLCMIAVVLIALKVLALGYTVFNYAFLSNFCRYRFPFVRDWMCSSWDEVEKTRIEGFGADDTMCLAFQHVLDDASNYVSSELPIYLCRYMTNIRAFRANLPAQRSHQANKNSSSDASRNTSIKAPKPFDMPRNFMPTSLALSNTASSIRSGLFSKLLMLILASMSIYLQMSTAPSRRACFTQLLLICLSSGRN